MRRHHPRRHERKAQVVSRRLRCRARPDSPLQRHRGTRRSGDRQQVLDLLGGHDLRDRHLDLSSRTGSGDRLVGEVRPVAEISVVVVENEDVGQSVVDPVVSVLRLHFDPPADVLSVVGEDLGLRLLGPDLTWAPRYSPRWKRRSRTAMSMSVPWSCAAVVRVAGHLRLAKALTAAASPRSPVSVASAARIGSGTSGLGGRPVTSVCC